MVGARDIAAADTIAPKTVAKILEKHGANTPEAARLKEIASADYAGNPEELRKAAGEKRDEAAQARFDAEGLVAKAADEAGRQLADAVVKSMKRAIDVAVQNIYNQVFLGKNSPGR
jgi:hypothetical protein